MPKSTVRKMLGKADSPYIVDLMRLIETQSKQTIANWCLDYTEKNILQIYETAYPDDTRPRSALNAARDWLAGTIKLPAAKQFILAAHAAARESEGNHAAHAAARESEGNHAAQSAARESEGNHAAQSAARACGQAASTIHMATHSLGMAFYGAAAIAYDRVGTTETADVYDTIAAEECTKMLKALADIAVENEPNPAKINWRC